MRRKENKRFSELCSFRAMANGGEKANINESCRFCDKNVQIRGVIAHLLQSTSSIAASASSVFSE